MGIATSGALKCNIDVALFVDAERMYGIGCIICDEKGSFIEAKTFRGSPSPKEVEASRLLHNIKCLLESGYQDMNIELDCKLVVDNLLCDKPASIT